jgi:hypothetical protein
LGLAPADECGASPALTKARARYHKPAMTSDVGGNLEIISLNRFLGPVDDYVTTNSPVKKVTCPSEGTNQIQKKKIYSTNSLK